MPLVDRVTRVRDRMRDLDIDLLLLSTGPDLPWLTGYEAMPLERLTMLVVRADREPVLVVPRLEAPRVADPEGLLAVRPWDETDDPVAAVAGIGRGARRVAIGDHTWARFVLALQAALPGALFVPASTVTAALRAVKDPAEVEALRAAARAVDAVAAEMRDRPFAGRTEAQVSRELAERMLDHGHQQANFAIVASGPNGASPHHEPGERAIRRGDVVVCDFGGRRDLYCSDITRVYAVGEPAPEVRDAYTVLAAAQEAAVHAATVGTPGEQVDAAARDVIAAAGLGRYFVHRTGHGIGIEAHEEPYLVEGNDAPLRAGNAFSVEPGVYLPGRFGLRLEDIVVATEAGPDRLNTAPRDLAVVG